MACDCRDTVVASQLKRSQINELANECPEGMTAAERDAWCSGFLRGKASRAPAQQGGEVVGWHPIETAPKDKRVLLLFPDLFPTPCVEFGQWEDDRYAKKPRPYWSGERPHFANSYRARQPSHWQPEPSTEVRPLVYGNAAPVQPVVDRPIARVEGYYGGHCVIIPLNTAQLLPTGLALYTHPPASPADMPAVDCAVCGLHQPTILVDRMGGYVCLPCINDDLQKTCADAVDAGRWRIDLPKFACVLDGLVDDVQGNCVSCRVCIAVMDGKEVQLLVTSHDDELSGDDGFICVHSDAAMAQAGGEHE